MVTPLPIFALLLDVAFHCASVPAKLMVVKAAVQSFNAPSSMRVIQLHAAFCLVQYAMINSSFFENRRKPTVDENFPKPN